MNEPRSLRYDIAEVIGLVADARLKANDGRICDLAAIVPRIEGVCARLQSMDRAEALRLVPLIEKLMGDLDETGRAMERQQRRILGEDWRASMENSLRT
ncbi:MAG: hypothetical protein KIT81_03005 [Alphaproteobacteria bacterium]|nr:hypothetical protein [Alphaproteobacteria bacterium]